MAYLSHGVIAAGRFHYELDKNLGKKKLAKFKKFQINKDLVSLAKKDCMIMHCLPAHREVEITSEVLDSANSIVWDQAENRLHLQKGLLLKLMGDK